ncbi:MAG TPA: hypothetical protein VHD31_01635 [Candidatus Paceibacterota bacterium]|nr:hypothetical protein [Candidatus Paceibacterota bacterium]
MFSREHLKRRKVRMNGTPSRSKWRKPAVNKAPKKKVRPAPKVSVIGQSAKSGRERFQDRYGTFLSGMGS